ncbi:MAG TPA: poly(R)-hydroxyalkanoic acid synthase subunit PhaE [Anaerolineae bacterium]|nr:poly(R)-hydroxyalkanoic acid synthase subunit PhaE [Anaerolineae bacterium]
MEWQKQTEEMWQAWSNAQQTMWQGWGNMMNQNNGNGTFPPNIWAGWEQMMRQNLDYMMPNASDTVKQATEQMLSAQQNMMRFMEVAFHTWQNIAPAAAQGADWQQMMNQWLQQANAPWANMMNQQMPDMQKMWAQYQNMWEPWGKFGQLPTMPTNNSEWAQWSQMLWDNYDQTVGNWLKSPELGLNRQLNEKIKLGFDSWTQVERTRIAYQAHVADIWQQAFKTFMETLVKWQEDGKEPITGVRQFMLVWTEVAENSFAEAFRDDKYVQLQGDYLNANLAHRLRQRDILEVLLNFYDLPTRTEMDQTHKRIYDLRKEVKALKKEMAELKKPARRRTSKKKEA